MVLLTSSAISVAISSGIVCIFTFLLFLSGYVLQQQTVKSLQEVLRSPPPKDPYPKPTLPPQFRDQNGSGIDLKVEDVLAVSSGSQERTVLLGGGAQTIVNVPSQPSVESEEPKEPTPQQLWYDYIRASISNGLLVHTDDSANADSKDQALTSDIIITQDSLAYILVLSEPSDLCSASLFTRWHREKTQLKTPPSIIFVYPAAWESVRSEVHDAALDLLREMQDKFNVICHPVSISRLWAGIEVESQLLSELQRTRWQYDRALYLRSPGLALDIPTLDKALASSDLKESWQQISRSTSNHPSLLLYATAKGLLAPRSDMTHLTAKASTSHQNHHADEIAVEEVSKHAAYVVFDNKELRHRQRERLSYSGLFERFERERRGVCAGTDLLGHEFEMDIAFSSR